MKTVLCTLLILCTSMVCRAADWRDIPWQNGQILGISLRAGLTPVLVHMGTRSRIDHIGIVAVEKDGPWLYEYTNATGIQKFPMSEVWLRSADRSGEVNFVLGEFTTPLTKAEWNTISRRLENWVNRADENAPRSCLDTVLAAIKGVRDLPVETTGVSPFVQSAFHGKIAAIIAKAYPGQKLFGVMSSAYDHLRRVGGNLPTNLKWTTETAFLEEWVRSGDLSKFVRSLFLQSRTVLSPDELKLQIPAVIQQLKEQSVHFSSPILCRAVLGEG